MHLPSLTLSIVAFPKRGSRSNFLLNKPRNRFGKRFAFPYTVNFFFSSTMGAFFMLKFCSQGINGWLWWEIFFITLGGTGGGFLVRTEVEARSEVDRDGSGNGQQ